MAINLEKVCWEVKKPPHNQDFDWLKELQSMRGKALYQGGLRPFFKVSDNTYSDADEYDQSCYHILAKFEGKIVGAIRLLVLDEAFNCVSAKIVGGVNQFSLIINELFPNQKIIEVSRLTVDEIFRRSHLYLLLMAVGWSLLFKLNGQMIANAGLKANFLIKHGGAQLFTKYAGPYNSKMYNDDVFLLYFDQRYLTDKMLSNIKEMKKILFNCF